MLEIIAKVYIAAVGLVIVLVTLPIAVVGMAVDEIVKMVGGE